MKLSRHTLTFVLMLLVVATQHANANFQIPPSPLPSPTGPFAIGRTLFDWTDPSRPDTISKVAGRNREIMVWVWYPASPKNGAQPTEWLPGKWGYVFYSEFQKSPSAIKGKPDNFIHTVRTHAFSDATVSSASKTYPVLLFSPGYGALPTQYAAVIEDIVSHGYIVAGIVPTYFSYLTVFPDGRLVGNQTSDMEQKNSLPIWVGDMAFTLSQLEKLNLDQKSPFRERFDFSRLGVFGHSRGGGAALEFARQNSRIKAVADLDGTPDATVSASGLRKPVLFLLGGQFSKMKKEAEAKPKNDPNNSGGRYEAVFRSGNPAFRISITGASHLSFSDIGLLPFVSDSEKARLGPINPARAISITNAYLEAFFDFFLNRKPSSLLDGPNRDFPDVEFEKNNK